MVRWSLVNRKRPRGVRGFPLGTLLTASMPLLGVVSLSAAMAPATTFLLGVWLPVGAVGLYGVAQRCASLVLLVHAAVSTVSAPRFAALYSRGELAELGATARRSALAAALIATPFLVACVPLGRFVLGVFGPEFLSASVALAVLTCGQFLVVIGGNAVDILMMTGNERSLRNIVAATTTAYVLLILALVPRFGIDGAAAARAVQLVGTALVSAVYVTRSVGVNLVPGPLRRRRGPR
jgi:O-antigen/teichoic acid export membrane protein